MAAIYGHGILQSAIEMAEAGLAVRGNPDPWTGPTVDLSHLTPAQRRGYLLADNRLSEDGEWDEEMLTIELASLHGDKFDLGLTGFDMPEIAQYLPGEFGGDDAPTAGTADLLSRMDITIAEPRHEVNPGDRFVLGEQHYLFCVSPIDEWEDWKDRKRCSTALLPLAGSAVLGWPEAAGFGLSLCSKLMTTLRADIGGLSC
jgi:hypothetical protein